MLQDHPAEKAVLAACYNCGREAYLDVADILQPSTFTLKPNEVLFCCLRHAYEKMEVEQPDIASLHVAAQDLGLSNKLDDPKYSLHIEQVIAFDSSSTNVRKYAARIRKLQIARLLKAKLEEINCDLSEITGSESMSDILAKAEGPILNFADLLNTGETKEPVTFASVVDGFLQNIEDNPGVPAISTGYPVYDNAIGGGLRYGSTSYVCARMKNFKSGIAINVGAHISSKLQIPVLYMDTEMQDGEQLPRLLGLLTGVDWLKIESGEALKNPADKSRLLEARDLIVNNPHFCHVNIAGMNFEDQLAVMRRWLFRTPKVGLNGKANPCVIIYDYVKLMGSDQISDAMRETQLMGFIATGLQNFAIRYNIPMLCFGQLNRDGLSKESTDVVAMSDRIGWFCSNLSIFKKKNVEEIQQDGINSGNYKLVPLIARHGPGLQDGDYINFHVEGNCFRIREGKLKSEPNEFTVEGLEDNVEF